MNLDDLENAYNDQLAHERRGEVIKSKMIYSGCGCEVIEHFPDFCPACRIGVLQHEVDMWREHVVELEGQLKETEYELTMHLTRTYGEEDYE